MLLQESLRYFNVGGPRDYIFPHTKPPDPQETDILKQT